LMDYRMLYEKLVAEAEENGLGGEFVDWGISISKWRATRWRSPCTDGCWKTSRKGWPRSRKGKSTGRWES
jgi:hypothetical protein